MFTASMVFSVTVIRVFKSKLKLKYTTLQLLDDTKYNNFICSKRRGKQNQSFSLCESIYMSNLFENVDLKSYEVKHWS